jgi:5-methyltetrahydrofolate--homocysteine methyltransferase
MLASFFSIERVGLNTMSDMRSIHQLECAIVKGDINRATALTGKCIQEGFHPSDIIEQGILRAMEIVGERWKSYEYFIPNVLVSAMATKLSLTILHPALMMLKAHSTGKAVAGTVRGDVHDIGKNILLMFMEANGFEIIDLGIDVAPEHYVKTVKKEKPDLLLLSCLYTVTMHSMEDTIIALKKAGLKNRVKILVGGAPVTKEFADNIGADAFGIDALDGVKKAKELIAVRNGGRKKDGFDSRTPSTGVGRRSSRGKGVLSNP